MPEAALSKGAHEAKPDAPAVVLAVVNDEEDLFSEASLTKIIKDYMPLVRHAVNRISVGSSNGGIGTRYCCSFLRSPKHFSFRSHARRTNISFFTKSKG